MVIHLMELSTLLIKFTASLVELFCFDDVRSS